MDCWPIIPALRTTAHHLHKGVKSMAAHGHFHHLPHAIAARTGPVVRAAVELACRKSVLFPAIAAATVAGGLLAAHVPPAPSAPSDAPGEDAAAPFIPAATWLPEGGTSQWPTGRQQTASDAANTPLPYTAPPVNGAPRFPVPPGGTPPVYTPAGPTIPAGPITPAGPLTPTTDTAIAEPAPIGAWAIGIAALLWVRRRGAHDPA